MSTLKTTTALLAGLAAGAVLGLLLAPKSGKETRNKLSETISHLENEVKDALTVQLERWSDLKLYVLDILNEKLFGIEPEDLPDDLEHA